MSAKTKVVTGEFEHRGTRYTYTSEIVDTWYGPEHKMVFSRDGIWQLTLQECMNTHSMIEMFKEQMDEIVLMQVEYQKELDEYQKEIEKNPIITCDCGHRYDARITRYCPQC